VTIDPFNLVLLGAFSGIILGSVITWGISERRIKDAYEKAKAEFETEKSEISEDISKSLGTMREGLITTVIAYEKAVRSVESRLPVSSESTKLLRGPNAKPLGIELKEDEDFVRAVEEERPENKKREESENSISEKIPNDQEKLVANS
jgi:hypothetical protein